MRLTALPLIGLLLAGLPHGSKAQTWDTLCRDDYRIDTAAVGSLNAEIDALAFFQNNEFSSKLQKGYTLPGAWLQPKLTISPLRQLHIEAGAHLMFYNGANRYPNYAYHDIVRWKGNQHSHGVHALPYFRAQADFKHLTLVLGNLYGAQNHRLIFPLFNPEQNLSTDPEMGFQLLLDRPRVHLDTWINWQSYIFEMDSHQEAFTVGVNSTLLWNRDKTKSLQWETPIQVILQHRGGEQDTTSMGVQTVCNASVGLRMTYRPAPSSLEANASPRKHSTLTALRAEVNALGSYQQHGTLWPFDTGFAIHGAVSATLWQRLGLEMGYVGIPHQYANLYGSPFFGTLSTRYNGLTFNGMHTLYATASYTYVFSPAYRLGAQLDLYSPHSSNVNATCFGFGVYLRVNPSFVLKKSKR